MNSIYGVSFYPRKLKPLYWMYIEHHSGFFLKSLLFIFVVGIFEKQETMPWRKRNALVSMRKKQPQNMIYFNLSKNFTTCKVVSLSFAWFFSLCYHRNHYCVEKDVGQFDGCSQQFSHNILYHRIYFIKHCGLTCDKQFTQLAFQQERGALDASV